MYFDNGWLPIEGAELTSFCAQINPVDSKYPVVEGSTDIAWRPLPFYDTVRLVRVKDPGWEPANLFIYYLTDGGNLFRLNGTSPPIHEVNAKAPIRLTQDNCLAYLEFFCFYVRGDEGPFLIAQSMEDTYVPKDLDATTRLVLEGTLRPAHLEAVDGEGNFLVDAVVYYSNAIFIANFKIRPGGMVEMQDDEPIAADLPMKIDAPLS